MEFRTADMADLPQIKKMFREMIEKMKLDNIDIWDELYPCEFFKEDIEKHRLYVLLENAEILSAFALCAANAGADAVQWESKEGKALYLDRFGVHPGYTRKGIGGLMLNQAAALAKESGAAYLRLFVVDINQPAINLYLKNGFKKVAGVFEERIDCDLVLREYGFERKTNV